MSKFFPILSIFLKQVYSDKINLGLTIFTTPFFIFFYWLTFTEIQDNTESNNYSFDNFVPGLLVFSMIMIVFSSAIAIASEKENGTLLRIQMTGVQDFTIAIGFGMVQFMISLCAFSLSLFISFLLGFDIHYINNLFLFVASLNIISMIGLGIALGSISTSINRAFLMSSSVMFLLLLFSGIVFPKPNIVYEISFLPKQKFYLFDILPSSLTISTFRRILSSGHNTIDLKFEILFLFTLTVFYSTCGYLLFKFKSKE